MVRVHLFAVCVLALASSAAAQPQFGFHVGAAVPAGGLAQYRSAGLSATATAGLGTERRGVGGRAEVSALHLFGRTPPSAREAPLYGAYSALGFRGSLVYTLSDSPRALYALAGAGGYAVAVTDQSNPYGLVSGVHAGVGLKVPAGATRLLVELQAVGLLTDFGAGEFEFPTVHVPLTVGVRF